MIDSTAGVRRAAEEEVEKAYEFLAKYAQSPQAKPSVIAGRKRMLDTVTDAFNAQEATIEELRTQVEILSKRIKYDQTPKRITYQRPATWLDVVDLFSSTWKDALSNTSERKEAFRAQHLLQVQQRWGDHF